MLLLSLTSLVVVGAAPVKPRVRAAAAALGDSASDGSGDEMDEKHGPVAEASPKRKSPPPAKPKGGMLRPPAPKVLTAKKRKRKAA